MLFNVPRTGMSRTFEICLALVYPIAIVCAATSPAPLSFPVDSSRWIGYDGNWSPVTLRLGNPEQWVYVLPNILSQEIWVIGPDGCDGTYACESERGGIFNMAESTTWSGYGSYQLGFDTDLGVTGSANYGGDIVSLSDSVTTADQVIGIINSTEFWTGYLGLGVEVTEFMSSSKLTFLSTLVENNSQVPSHTFAYTAGAHYRLKGVPASLTFGGVDVNRFVETDTSFFLTSNSQPVVAINEISVTAGPSSTSDQPNWTSPLSLATLDEAALFTIDSSTPFLWMPPTICDAFADALGLFYNETLDLYTFEGNSTTSPDELSRWNLTFTFTIADLPGSSNAVNLTLPYDAFNLQLVYPFPNLWANYTSPGTNYFPLRRARNEDQYTIGRMFLQETYIIVDYERGNFSLSQANFRSDATANINLVKITRPSNSSYTGPHVVSSNLSVGAKVGIGVGSAVGFLLLLCLAVLLLVLRRQRRTPDSEKPEIHRRTQFFKLLPSQASRSTQDIKQGTPPTELPASKHQPTEVAAAPRFELEGSTPVEAQGSTVPSSYYSSATRRPNGPMGVAKNRRSSDFKAPNTGSNPELVQHDGHNLPKYTPTTDEHRRRSSISPNNTIEPDDRISIGPFPNTAMRTTQLTNESSADDNHVRPITPIGTSPSSTSGSVRPRAPRSVSYSNTIPSNDHLGIPSADTAGVSRSASARSSRFREEGLDIGPLVTAQEQLQELGHDSGYHIRDPAGNMPERRLSRLARLMRSGTLREPKENEQTRRFSWEEG